MHHIHKKKLEEFSQLLGLEKNEQEAFYAIANIQSGTVLMIAKEIPHIGRITVHNIIAKLILADILIEEKIGKKRIISIAPISSLEKIISQQIEKGEKMSSLLEDLHLFLTKNKSDLSQIPNSTIMNGKTGAEHMFSTCLTEKKDMHVLSDNNKFTKYMPTYYIRRHYKKRAKEGIHTYFIAPQNIENIRKEEETLDHIHIKKVSFGNLHGGGINICGEHVYFHTYHPENSTTIHIKNPIIAQMTLFMRKRIRETSK